MHLLLLTFQIYAQPQLIVNDTHIVNDETTDSDSEVDRTDDEKNESNNPPEIVLKMKNYLLISTTRKHSYPQRFPRCLFDFESYRWCCSTNMGAIGDFSSVRFAVPLFGRLRSLLMA